MTDLLGVSLSQTQWVILLLVAILSGMGKAGIYGAGMISVPLMAFAFGSKDSTGILLTLLIFADVFAVMIYRRDANWSMLRQLLPTAFVGVLIGTYAGAVIDDVSFQRIMAIVILVCVALMLWQELRKSSVVPAWRGFAPGMGVTGGFTTMVGNLGGPVLALYLLAMRVPKREFLGTAAWFFLTINLLKVPFHVVVWETIDWQSFLLTLLFLPLVGLGIYLGVVLVKRINEVLFRRFVIAMTFVSALVLLA